MPPRSGVRVQIEVCVESLAGVVAAARAGADRVELCAALSEGGLTPSAGTIAAAREVAGIGLVVLVRPRGGDFLYDERELEVLRRDVRCARAAGADGVALGVLTADGAVDVARMSELVALARPMQVTFHRAFDHAREPLATLDELIELGVERVLSSGQEATAVAGVELLRRMVARAAGRIAVMPGGGVRPANVAELVRATGAREVHFSAGREIESPVRWRNSRCSLASTAAPAEDRLVVPDEARIRGVIEALRDVRP